MSHLDVIVTGSRIWDDALFVRSVLVDVRKVVGTMTLMHGACPKGVDDIADRWARGREDEGLAVIRFPADWTIYGKRAGIMRNQKMVDAGADLCLAFIRDGSKGASHCARIAEAAEIETRIFRWEDR